jgi:hypothetical protein
MEAARAFLETFAPNEMPTPDEQRALVELWTRPREAPSSLVRSRRTAKRRSRAA